MPDIPADRRHKLPDTAKIPSNPLAFIKDCVGQGRLFWTYHVNMRLTSRKIGRAMIVGSVDTYETIEAYPGDKYLPSYLVFARHENHVIHILFATDVPGINVRVVTAYRPDPREWEMDLKKRRAP